MKECPICHTCFSDNNEVCNNDKSPLLDLIAGSHIIADKYRLDRKIGVGRIGIVFQATVLKTGQRVAIKIVSPLLVEADPSLAEKFFVLIEAFAALEHVNIVKIFDFGLVEPNILYFVMEFLALPTLADLLQEQKRLSLELALNITSKVCEAIANANRSAVFHLDLKPSNIFVERVESKQQIVKVVDFGLVRLKAPSLISALSPMQRDYLLGKPYYSAPEQFTSEQIDPRSEVYAIGAILYHLLAGNPPFTGGSYPMLKMQHIGVTPPSLREIRPEIPLTLESIIIKALDKRSAQRHSSVIALAVQLSAQLAKYKEFLLSQSSNNTIPSLPSPPEPFYSSDPTPPPISKYPSKEVFLSQSNNTIPSLPSPPEPFYSSDPTPPPIGRYSSKEVLLAESNNTLPSLPSPPEPFYSSDPTPPPISVSYAPASVSDSSLNSLDLELDSLPEEESYSSDLQKTPVTKYSSISKSNDTLAGLPDLEPFYSNDPTPVPILGKQTSPEGKLEETLGAFPPKPESAYSSESININEKASISNFKLEETLGAFSDSDPFRSRGMATARKTNTASSEIAKENSNFNKPHSATEPVYSLPSLLSPTLRIEEGNIVTRPLASESFYIGEEFEEIIKSSIKEEVKAVEQVDVDIDVAFEQAGIGESAETLSVSKYLSLSSEQAYKEVYQLSPSAVIYLFAEYFVPTLLSGQRGRQMHNNFSTEREHLAALLLVSALFSLFCRGVIELSIGSSAQKKQIALSQKNEGIIIRAVNLDIPALDILETKIVDSLKQSGTTRFYNIFLYIAQTSVATSQREAICEVVTDMIADELSVRKFLQAKQKNRRLESGESAVQYELACDLLPYRNQALAVEDWLQGLQQQASIELAGKTVQPFIHILKYYTDLFRHNSKELSKS